MGFADLFVLAVGLSMDAFAVSVCKGLSIRVLLPRHAVTVGLWFGAFQALMPAVGWLLGSAFADVIAAVDHWIAFGLLAFIGGKMLLDALSGGGDEPESTDLSPRRLCVLAVATSIDALAVGVSMAFMKVDIFLSAGVIGLVAFGMSVAGGLVGRRLGGLFQRRATLAGGVVLIGIGVKILVEHLGG